MSKRKETPPARPSAAPDDHLATVNAAAGEPRETAVTVTSEAAAPEETPAGVASEAAAPEEAPAAAPSASTKPDETPAARVGEGAEPEETPAGRAGEETAPAETPAARAGEGAEPAAEPIGPDRAEMEAAIEAILFVSSEPVPRGKLVDLFEEEQREQATAALDAVLARYGAGDGRGVMVEDVAGGVRVVTRPEMGTWLRRFFEVSSGNKLSMAALETLAIVAYRQPITGPEIQELRSVSPTGVLKTLLEKRLVRIAGRKEVVGKPFLYTTTREFLVHFGLNSLRDLPPLEEFEETFGAAAGGAAAGDLAGLVGEDREETILRQAAELADREDGAASDEPEAEAAAAARASAWSGSGSGGGTEEP
jgi:segregation and condensation protein B